MKIVILVVMCSLAFASNGTDLISEQYQIYYDPSTGNVLPGKFVMNEKQPEQKILFGNLPCSCESLICDCCAGVNISVFNFDRKACAKFQYDPIEFSILMDVTMNGENIFSHSVSGKNPQPFCIPIPGFFGIAFCIRLFNIFTPGRNIHACIDFETRVVQSPILVLHFDCLRLGADGIAWLKPEDNGGLQTPESYSQPSYLPHDEVDFESDNITNILCANATTISPAEQNNIGQWKGD